MKKLIVTSILLGLILTQAPSAQAFIIDTGTPTDTFGYGFYHNSFDQYVWFAGQFSIGTDYTLTSLEGYIYSDNNTGVADAVIYGNTLGEVNDSAEIFRQSFSVSNDPRGYDWRGVYGLDLELAAGTYWLAFEAVNPGDLNSAILDGVPAPLSNYAQNYYASPGWTNASTLDLGMRIDGWQNTASVVPEPASVLLFTTGLAGAFVGRKRRGR